jgi:uncharacterized membrane protein
MHLLDHNKMRANFAESTDNIANCLISSSKDTVMLQYLSFAVNFSLVLSLIDFLGQGL